VSELFAASTELCAVDKESFPREVRSHSWLLTNQPRNAPEGELSDRHKSKSQPEASVGCADCIAPQLSEVAHCSTFVHRAETWRVLLFKGWGSQDAYALRFEAGTLDFVKSVVIE